MVSFISFAPGQTSTEYAEHSDCSCGVEDSLGVLTN